MPLGEVPQLIIFSPRSKFPVYSVAKIRYASQLLPKNTGTTMVSFKSIMSIALSLGFSTAQSPATISFNPVYDSAFAVANTACGGAEGPNPFSTLTASKGWTTLDQIQANLVASPLAINRTEVSSHELPIQLHTVLYSVTDGVYREMCVLLLKMLMTWYLSVDSAIESRSMAPVSMR